MTLNLHHSAISKNATVIVGVSGGRDSMSLVHALMIQRKDLTIIPAHMNHGLRASADDDALFTEAMMTRWELPFESYKPRAPKAGNLENWGREKRYEFFNKLAKKYKAEWILTGHHQDDDFESMLMHFMRGTRVKGLSGMAFQRENILRPLLFTSRKEINNYVETHDIHYRNDPTNQDENLTRNFLRHKVVPVFNHMYPEFADRWQTQKDYWEDLQEMLEVEAEKFLEAHLSPKEGLNREAYRNLPLPTRATVLELWYKESTGKRIADATSIHRWDTAIQNWHSRKKTEWDDGRFLTMTKEHAKLTK